MKGYCETGTQRGPGEAKILVFGWVVRPNSNSGAQICPQLLRLWRHCRHGNLL